MKKLMILYCLMINGGLIAATNKTNWAPLIMIKNLSSYSMMGGSLVVNTLFDPIKEAIRHCGIVENDELRDIDPIKVHATCLEFLNVGCKKGKSLAGITDVFMSSTMIQKAGCVIACAVVVPLAVYGAYNLVPVIAKKYRAKYHPADDE
jgi:hypothetical protein